MIKRAIIHISDLSTIIRLGFSILNYWYVEPFSRVLVSLFEINIWEFSEKMFMSCEGARLFSEKLFMSRKGVKLFSKKLFMSCEGVF